MPGLDGTGPGGMGPMTGGARGWCNPYSPLRAGGYPYGGFSPYAPGALSGSPYGMGPYGGFGAYGGWPGAGYGMTAPFYPGAYPYAMPYGFGRFGMGFGMGMGMGMGFGGRGMRGGRGRRMWW